MNLKDYIASIPGFPKEGIMFRDVTPILNDPDAFEYTTKQLADYAKKVGATKVLGPEARGFIFGTPVSILNHIGFVPVRKPGKLPRKQLTEEYALEYGTNTLCIHEDALKKGDKVVIIDDLLATGGTALAAAHLAEKAGAEVVGMAFVVELPDLKPREILKDYDVFSLVEYEGE